MEVKEYEDDLCDFCGTECHCTTRKESKTEEEDGVWLKTFCPEDSCLNKTGTELV
jgi:hypothetical protein